MVFLRKILFPFAVLYGWITGFRNFLFDRGILKSYAFDVPVIAVGNLSVGGTGKTPQIEYLIRLLSPNYKIAVLSRGYKRQTKGFILAGALDNAKTLGDEPFQYHRKFPEIQVAVDADRKNGIQQLLSQNRKPDVILLDDAYQHRKVKAGLYILLTAYNDLYADDFMLPTGNLRESRRGAQRADVIIVTKCPADLSVKEQLKIKLKLDILPRQQLYFTAVDYGDFVYSENKTLPVSQINNVDKVLLAGIAKPKPFFAYLQGRNDEVLQFADHHDFSDADIAEIKRKAKNRPILTTEKDYVRLQGKLPGSPLFYLPIRSLFLNETEKFDKTITDYVGKSTADRSIH